MSSPLVSVITPTWQRHDLLLSRCIPSVGEQTYPNVEHIVVSGPDPELKSRLVAAASVAFLVEMPENVVDGGATPRRVGAELARGKYIAYLDDDNAWRPDHLSLLVGMLEAGADFAYSQMQRWRGDRMLDIIGSPPPRYGDIDTSMIAHRRDLVAGAWQSPNGYTGPHTASPDWETVARWLENGARWASVAQVTVDYWFDEPGGSRCA